MQQIEAQRWGQSDARVPAAEALAQGGLQSSKGCVLDGEGPLWKSEPARVGAGSVSPPLGSGPPGRQVTHVLPVGRTRCTPEPRSSSRPRPAAAPAEGTGKVQGGVAPEAGEGWGGWG